MVMCQVVAWALGYIPPTIWLKHTKVLYLINVSTPVEVLFSLLFCLMMKASTNRKIDRKSTRLNSSHQIISYAVFCLKKKNGKVDQEIRQLLIRGGASGAHARVES